MGYTHYWTIKEGITQDEWKKALQLCKTIVEAAPAGVLAGGAGEEGTDPTVGGTICFNGIGENSHETFYLGSTPGEDAMPTKEGLFSFCKTAQKPYDSTVCACLIALKCVLGDKVEVSSDGDIPGEWESGLMEFNAVTELDVAIKETEKHDLVVIAAKKKKKVPTVRECVEAAKSGLIRADEKPTKKKIELAKDASSLIAELPQNQETVDYLTRTVACYESNLERIRDRALESNHADLAGFVIKILEQGKKE